MRLCSERTRSAGPRYDAAEARRILWLSSEFGSGAITGDEFAVPGEHTPAQRPAYPEPSAKAARAGGPGCAATMTSAAMVAQLMHFQRRIDDVGF